LYTNIAHLAQSYFHQDFQEEADDPIEIVERFRDSEPAEVAEALRAEIVTLIESDATEEDLSRIWLEDAGAYYDPAYDEITMRKWLLNIVEVLARKDVPADGDQPPGPADAGADGTAGSADPGPGIPFKGSTGA
jgi:hypothetical protein